MEDILAITLIFGGGTLFLLSISPIGKAIGDRIRGRGLDSGSEGIRELQDGYDALLEEVDTLRGEVADLQERVDFTERLMSQRDRKELPPASGV
ncbi:MAG: hypothetical protein OEY63_06810 [Gemmatimonadota bacterium]|nr:hypothetical protein [Gemmatimonadota bacterium]MDH5805298.1 hypothetical protein [Gemmatimonadota bacterium]